MLMNKRLALAGLATLGLGLHYSWAQDADGKLAFSSDPSDAQAIAIGLLERESGETIDPGDVLVAEADLNDDGVSEIFAYARNTYFCGSAGCSFQLYGEIAGEYRSIIDGEGGFTLIEPDGITVSARAREGYYDILLGDFLMGWDGANYVEASGPPPTDLDGTEFQEACNRHQPYVDAFGDGGDPISARGELCFCLFHAYQQASFGDHELYLVTRQLDDLLTDEDIQSYGETYEDFSAAAREVEQACFPDTGAVTE